MNPDILKKAETLNNDRLEGEKVSRIADLLREKDGVESSYKANTARITKEIERVSGMTKMGDLWGNGCFSSNDTACEGKRKY